MTPSIARPSPLLVLLAWVAVIALLLIGWPIATADFPSLTQLLSYAVVGGFLAIRRPDNAVGWLLIAIGFAFVGTSTPPWIDLPALEAGTAAPRDVIWAWTSVWSGGASFLLYAAVAMTFPSGHLPSGRWRTWCIAALAAGVAAISLPAFVRTIVFNVEGMREIRVSNPFGLLPDPPADALGAGQAIVTLVPMVVLAAAVIGLIVRYRRSEGVVRLQIRWLLAAMAFLIVAVVFGLAIFVLSDFTAGYAWIPALIAYPLVPLAVGVAVMRYRLFEIDRIISRTIAYAGLSAILFATFGGLIIAIQSLLGSAVRGNSLAVALSTLVVAALFNPVRLRIQRLVDQRFNRSRFDHDKALATLVVELRDVVDVDRLTDALDAVLQRTVQPSTVAIWRRPAGGDR
jgi:hypothetical protein